MYKLKYNADGTLERYKARLMAKGFIQQVGIDYEGTFSPVVKMVIVRLVLAIVSMKDWPLFHLDVDNAFLQGDLQEEIYMNLPQGFSNQPDKPLVCKLHKSLYGLKQASKAWNTKLTNALLISGFQQSPIDHSFFFKKHNGHIVIFLVYVDDLVITGSDSSLI